MQSQAHGILEGNTLANPIVLLMSMGDDDDLLSSDLSA